MDQDGVEGELRIGQVGTRRREGAEGMRGGESDRGGRRKRRGGDARAVSPGMRESEPLQMELSPDAPW